MITQAIVHERVYLHTAEVFWGSRSRNTASDDLQQRKYFVIEATFPCNVTNFNIGLKFKFSIPHLCNALISKRIGINIFNYLKNNVKRLLIGAS